MPNMKCQSGIVPKLWQRFKLTTGKRTDLKQNTCTRMLDNSISRQNEVSGHKTKSIQKAHSKSSNELKIKKMQQ